MNSRNFTYFLGIFLLFVTIDGEFTVHAQMFAIILAVWTFSAVDEILSLFNLSIVVLHSRAQQPVRIVSRFIKIIYFLINSISHRRHAAALEPAMLAALAVSAVVVIFRRRKEFFRNFSPLLQLFNSKSICLVRQSRAVVSIIPIKMNINEVARRSRVYNIFCGSTRYSLLRKYWKRQPKKNERLDEWDLWTIRTRNWDWWQRGWYAIVRVRVTQYGWSSVHDDEHAT